MMRIYRLSTFFSLLFIQLFVPGFVLAQQEGADSANINIYVNKKTGKTSSYSCASIKLPTNYIKGSVSVTTSGPLVYAPLANKAEQNGLFGQVMADIAKAPAPGLDAKGRLYIEYEQPADGNNSLNLVNKKRIKVKFTIYSVKLYMKDTIPVCSGKELNIPCLASPPGGSYDWSVSGDITLLSKPGERVPAIVANAKGSGTATLRYTIGGVCYTSQSLVLNINKPLINAPDTLTVYSGNVFTIKPKFLPEGGDCEWLVKEPLLLYGDNMNYGSAKIYAGKPGIATVSILYKSCMATSKKNVVVIIKNSQDVAANIANANASKNQATPQYNGYYGYGYFGYNNYYSPAANKPQIAAAGPYVTYKNSSKLDLTSPSIIENNIIVPDSIVLNSGEKQEVKPFIAPEGGSFNWEAAGSISIEWASLKATAYIEGLQEGTGYAKVTYTDGKKVIVKKIKVIVKGDK